MNSPPSRPFHGHGLPRAPGSAPAAAPSASAAVDPALLGDVYALERDPGVRTLLRHGWTMGCFYIESPAMRGLLVKLRTETFEGVVAASSVIRPGVAESGMMREYVERATGRKKAVYLHPALEPLLGETHGILVYQEDVLKVAHAVGGLTLGEADLLRRAMSGKGRSHEAMERLRARFFQGCRRNRLDPRTSEEVWRQIESFAGYAFCKGHSAAFAVLSLRTAWLKAHYPAEFLASVLGNGGGYYSTAAYVEEARRLGIGVAGPCVNRGRLDWWGETRIPPDGVEWWQRRAAGQSLAVSAVSGTGGAPPTGRIRAGMLSVAGLSHETVVRLLRTRARDGAFRHPEDFWSRARPTPDEACRLILCGALDGFGTTRARLMLEHARWHRRRATADRNPLFPHDIETPPPGT